MNPERHGVPTAYRGVMFRSRLEAAWASMFDRLGWNWSYEPFDCAGWIPDFALTSEGGCGRPVLVEVKPIETFDGDTAAKIDAADRRHEVLLTGYLLPTWNGRVTAGWLRDENMDWAPAPFGRWAGTASGGGGGPDLVGFCHGTGSFHDRITGRDDGPCYGSCAVGELALDAMWKAARNETQWRGDPAGVFRVVDRLRDVDSDLAEFVARRPDWHMRRDDELDRLVDQETDPAAGKRLVSALLGAGEITFGQARRQVDRRPELAEA